MNLGIFPLGDRNFPPLGAERRQFAPLVPL